MKASFIGLGIMGSRMAANLAKNGIELTVYNRSKEKARELEKYGATVADSLEEAVKESDVIFTMLSKPEVVEKLAFGDKGFIQQMNEDALWVDCSTVDPTFSREMGELATKAGIRFMDAPVAGTKQPAENGELVFFVGGNESDLGSISQFLDIMGKKTVHMGPIGNGSSIKMLINLMLAQSMAAFSEAVHLGVDMGLNEEKVYNILANIPVTAPVLELLKPKLLGEDTSANFPLKWMQKDLHLVSKVAFETGTPMPLANAAKELFASAKEAGHGDEDFSTLYPYLLGK